MIKIVNKKEIIRLLSEDSYFSGFKPTSIGFKKKDGKDWEVIELFGYPRWWDDKYEDALGIRVSFLKRFDVLHRWFEPFRATTQQELRDLRSHYTVGITHDMYFPDREHYYTFPFDGSEFEERLENMRRDIVEIGTYFFDKYKTLNDYYKNDVEPIIADEHFKLGNDCIHWYLYLKAAKLVSPEKYCQIQQKIMEHIESLHSWHEPNLENVYPKLEEILNAV